jgi:hypothetical protein
MFLSPSACQVVRDFLERFAARLEAEQVTAYAAHKQDYSHDGEEYVVRSSRAKENAKERRNDDCADALKSGGPPGARRAETCGVDLAAVGKKRASVTGSEERRQGTED